MKKLIILSLAAIFSTNQAFAVATTGTSNVKVFQTLSIAANTALEFGNIATTGTEGSVVLTAAASTTPTATNVTLVSGTTRTAGKFIVTGETGATYTISLPSSITLAGSGSATGQTMTVDTFTSSPSTTGTLAAGDNNLFIGAKLTVAAAQVPGPYSGTYNVTVNY
jgi:hypothetical protein